MPTSSIELALSEDAYQGNAQVLVTLDGQNSKTFNVTAINASNQAEPILAYIGIDNTVPHTLFVQFTNDLYGGSPSADRNAYVLGCQWNGNFISCNTALKAQNQSVTIQLPAAATSEPAPTPAPNPAPTPASPPPTPAVSPTLSITSWANFKTSANGSSTTWSNSIPPGGNRTLNGSDEQEWYTDPTVAGAYNPFSVDPDGSLVITATPCAANPNQGNKTYQSGACTTIGFFNQQYGSFRVVASMCSGNGWRPAIWMLPSNLQYSGEIDLMEEWQGDINHVHQTIHGMINNSWQSPNTTPVVSPDDTNYHEYRIDWNATNITCYVDGVQTMQCPTPTGLNTPCYLILNMGVGAPGSWCGNPAPGAVGAMKVKSVVCTA